MRFVSVLFGDREDSASVNAAIEFDFFPDLNIDQIVDAATAGRDEYELRPFFQTPLHSVDAVGWRHDVFRDLSHAPVAGTIQAFARGMHSMREHLTESGKRYESRQKQSWFLDAVECYCDTVARFARELAETEVRSDALLAFRRYLSGYADSAGFAALRTEIVGIRRGIASVAYSVEIKANRVTVGRYGDESDYSAEIAATFEKFRRGAVRDYRVRYPESADMNQVEAQVLDLVARLYPEVFSPLDAFCEHRRDYLDEVIGRFDREVQFYLCYLEHMHRISAAGLSFCYPEVSAESKQILLRGTFDLALADKLVPEKQSVVCNDFELSGRERVYVVSGPNQGGKTTMARTFGQLHYLASLGLPVPGTEARLALPDRIFAHFERQEDLSNLRGKLQDDLVRIHEILTTATPASIVILNEAFTSTTLADALLLGERVLRELIELDALGVYVTFVDELASLDPAIVSMVSTVVRDNPAVRTYKLVRRPADGLSYAIAIAEKYGLTYERLRERIGS